MYLESRIHGYKALKHDPIRVQSENNRKSQYEGSSGESLCSLTRGRTLSFVGGRGRVEAGFEGGWVVRPAGSFAGRTGKLNSLTVDKGLLREVREVQKIVACLIQCRVSRPSFNFGHGRVVLVADNVEWALDAVLRRRPRGPL